MHFEEGQGHMAMHRLTQITLLLYRQSSIAIYSWTLITTYAMYSHCIALSTILIAYQHQTFYMGTT